MQNPINTERSKGMEQVEIAERGTEQMEITMNSHGTIAMEWTHKINRGIKDMAK